MYSLVKLFARTYHKCWMFWHLRRTSKHSSSIEHAPKSSPTPLSPTELTTKATASISFGNSRMFRSSRVGLVATNCWASCWSWLSWIQWHSSNIWEIGNQIEITTTNIHMYVHIHKHTHILLIFIILYLMCLSGFTCANILPLVRSKCFCDTVYLAVGERGLVAF